MQMKGQSRAEVQSRDQWPDDTKGNGDFHEGRRKAGLEAGAPEVGGRGMEKKDKAPRQRAAEETVLRDSQVPIRARRKKERPEKLLRLLERIVLMTNQEFRKSQ